MWTRHQLWSWTLCLTPDFVRAPSFRTRVHTCMWSDTSESGLSPDMYICGARESRADPARGSGPPAVPVITGRVPCAARHATRRSRARRRRASSGRTRLAGHSRTRRQQESARESRADRCGCAAVCRAGPADGRDRTVSRPTSSRTRGVSGLCVRTQEDEVCPSSRANGLRLVPIHSRSDTLILKTRPTGLRVAPTSALPRTSCGPGRDDTSMWGVIWLPRERPNSSTSSDDCASSQRLRRGYRGVEPAAAVACGSTTPRRLCPSDGQRVSFAET